MIFLKIILFVTGAMGFAPTLTEFTPVILQDGQIIAVDSRMVAMMEKERLNDLAVADVYPLYVGPLENLVIAGGQLELDVMLSNTYASTIWAVKDDAALIVKYHVMDEDKIFDPTLRHFHPLSREFFMMRHIEHLDISLKVHFLSSSTPLPPIPSPKFLFKMSRRKWLKSFCAPVRFMIMERGNHSALQLFRADLNVAARLTSDMLRLLITLHDQGNMIHGDAHAGNFVVDKSRELKLIDFSSARFIQVPSSSIPVLPRSSHSLHSPWEMLGMIGARRDDVFRVILEFANALSFSGVSGSLFGWYDTLRWEDHFMVKASRNMFSHTPYAERLARISVLVQGMVDIDARPPYEELMALLYEAVNEPLSIVEEQVHDTVGELLHDHAAEAPSVGIVQSPRVDEVA